MLMTNAPANLLATRRLLLDHLGPFGLASAEVGIVGNVAHRGGYHCGSDRIVTNDYSVVESPRDRAGLTLDAAALDVGTFSVRVDGQTHNLMTFSTWLVSQCVLNAPDTRDIREIIYSPDGRTVKRWDRLRKRSTGDDSHLFHTHFSFFRDSVKAGRNQTPLFSRYLISIGLVQPPSPEDSDMAFDAEESKRAWATTQRAWALMTGKPAVYRFPGETKDRVETNYLALKLESLSAQLAALSGKDFTDEPAIVQGVLAALTPEKIAAAIPMEIAGDVVDELLNRLNRPAPPA